MLTSDDAWKHAFLHRIRPSDLLNDKLLYDEDDWYIFYRLYDDDDEYKFSMRDKLIVGGLWIMGGNS